MDGSGEVTLRPDGPSAPRPQRARFGRLRLIVGATLALASAALVAGGLLAPNGPEASDGVGAVGSAEAGLRPVARGLDIIDVHVHVSPAGVPRLVDLMGRRGITRAVNLSGGHPLSGLDEQLEAAARAAGKVIVFTTLAYEQARFPNYGERMAQLVRIAHARGARGLKIAKVLGLALTTRDGRRIAVDDPALDPVFATAGELGMPVAIHSGDPEAFWLPVDAKNPRRKELEAHPSWAVAGRDVPSFDGLLAELEARIARHRHTTFISVHFGNAAERPEYVARLLRQYPNLYIDTAARIPEMGRHDSSAMRAFFIEFQDRILYGSDLGVGPEPAPLFLGSEGKTPPTSREVERFFDSSRRYFETSDQRFDHPTPIQGDWKIDGIALPRAVLAKVYHHNAARVLSLE
jgi:predicted TIM-barrel fold metal-dependent hydrolase